MAVTGFARIIIVLTTISAAIMELIDTSIVNVALAQISGNLGATIEDTSWVITSYAIANVIIIPLTGFFARLFGRKNYYLASIILFTVASYMCGNSGSLVTLVIWRFIQGIGGGALLSTSQAILFDAFEPSKRPMAAGMFGMGIVLGPTIGPTLGGIIVDNYSWPLIFDINIPFGIVAMLLTYRFVPDDTDAQLNARKSVYIDYLGIFFLSIGIGSLQYVLERGETEDWFNDNWIVVLTGVAVVSLASFIYRQLKIDQPLVNLRVFKSRNLVASNVLTFVLGVGLFGSVFIFPVLVQRILGYTPTDAGFGLVPGAIVAIFCMPVIGKTLQSGIPPLYYVIIGCVMFILHGYTSSLANPDAGLEFFTLPQVFRGVGTACLTVPLINQAVVGLTPQELPSGIALTNMIRQLGGATGIAIMNTYVSHRYVAHRTDLVSNLQVFDPATAERLSMYQAGVISRGVDAAQSGEASYRILDAALSKQGFLLAYLDGFLLISIFFIAAIPFIFLLKTNKVDKATMQKISEESH
ncbi:DHA2 family efflux MFS transporter permease subunit [Chryseosolibacter indicus]|uniref:DHA2 family efflux MFS transporter permease subunit n=1 Tax=Chryseosolibacter indicus TaxID=2782351 RepID=A0ABS5VLW3_9BACT|nr:DHA2 family efflux MFS transporter permease subunit [Chryseosolibacter indicus]MBT1702437.1 DHA2 family efflux MFS transporter permease subunit [Chryseosolibacter indicus]